VTPPAKRVEVQFLIERNCHDDEPFEAFGDDKLPYAVWVYFPAGPLSPSPSNCSGNLFQITPADVPRVFAHFGRCSSANRVFICEHMGHVIE